MGLREEHLIQLASEINCNIVLQPEPEFNQNGELPDAFAIFDVAKVTGWDEEIQMRYFSGLHEMGHVYYGHSNKMNDYYLKNKVKCESLCWLYAFDNSLEEPDSTTCKIIKYCIETYVWENPIMNWWNYLRKESYLPQVLNYINEMGQNNETK